MSYLNVEIKARCQDAAAIRNYLVTNNADFKGLDHQTDTYFNVPAGRLKLREGKIENNLIYYKRPDKAGPKQSYFHLATISDPVSMKSLLTDALGIMQTVTKRREIYYIKNVKFHIDEVPGLGSFVEIEAGNIHADLSEVELKQQCEFYMKEFGIAPGDLIENSYSDMLVTTPGITL